MLSRLVKTFRRFRLKCDRSADFNERKHLIVNENFSPVGASLTAFQCFEKFKNPQLGHH